MADNIYQKDEQTFGEEVTFYKNVFFKQDIEISGNLKVGGSSGLRADALNGGEQGSIPYQSSSTSTSFLPPTNAAGRFLKSNGPGQDPEWVAIGGGQGALNLDSLQDVDNDVANATNGQIIRYNSSTSKWERFTPNYLTAETSHADVVIDGDFTSEGLMKRGSSAGSYTVVTDNSSNWNVAFGWGDHSSVGYIEDSDFSANGFMKRTGSGSYTVDTSTYISNIGSENLGDLANVNVPATPTFGHVLKWTGTNWTAEADGGGGGGGGGGAGVDGAPAGTVSMWSGTSASVPSGYLLCDGSAISRVTYTDLFNAIGTAHGSGDGSTTFNLPNLSNRFVVGKGSSFTLAATGGSADATLVSHSHTVNSHSHSSANLSTDNHSHGSGNLGVNSHSHNVNGHTNKTGSHSHSGNIPTPLYVPGGDVDRGDSSSIFSIDNSQTQFTNNTGSHSHNVNGNTSSESPGVSGNTGSNSATISGSTGSDSPGTDSQGSSATNANLPPYYALCYIIKVTSGGAITSGETFTLTSTDAGAGAKPTLTMLRDSASPADNDLIGNIEFKGNDSAGNQETYVELKGKITDVTDTSEDSTLEVVVKKDGADKTITFPTETGTLALVSQLTSSFPAGGIIMWSGAENAIPTGWVLCNGSNSTPDLRNRFVVGAGTGSIYSVGDTGGSNDATLVSHSHNVNGNTNNTGDHSHSGNTNNTGDHSHSGNTNNTGDHAHRWGTDDAIGAAGGNANPDANGGQNWRAWTDTQGAHSHNLNTNNAGSHSHNINTNNTGSHSHNVNGNTDSQGSSATGANRPPYYALCYIMKS